MGCLKKEPLNDSPPLLHSLEEVKDGESFNSAAEILVHPNGQFVYSSNRGHDTVSVYQANPKTGKLKVIQVQPIRGAFPRNINLTPMPIGSSPPVRTPIPWPLTASIRKLENLPTNGVRSSMSPPPSVFCFWTKSQTSQSLRNVSSGS